MSKEKTGVNCQSRADLSSSRFVVFLFVFFAVVAVILFLLLGLFGFFLLVCFLLCFVF